MRTTRRLVAAGLSTWCCALGGVGSARAAAVSAPEVKPGTVVRWTGGSPATQCALADRKWAPIDGVCWYAIDLLATGNLTLERTVGGHSERRTVKVAAYPYPEQRIQIQDESKVNLSSADLVRAQREEAEVAKVFALSTARRFALPLAAPLEHLPAEGRFGTRRVFNGEPRSPHTGADYAATTGTEVRATADGTVVLAEEHFFSGNSVFIDHGDGLFTMYFHFSAIAVKPGETVTRGQLVGRVGATGRASGPHLHFGVRWHGARIDPSYLLQDPATVPALP